jgi:hypothetical protein
VERQYYGRNALLICPTQLLLSVGISREHKIANKASTRVCKHYGPNPLLPSPWRSSLHRGSLVPWAGERRNERVLLFSRGIRTNGVQVVVPQFVLICFTTSVGLKISNSIVKKIKLPFIRISWNCKIMSYTYVRPAETMQFYLKHYLMQWIINVIPGDTVKWFSLHTTHSPPPPLELARETAVLGEKTCPSATWSTTNPTWPDMGSNPGRRGGKPVPNRLSYGTALEYVAYKKRRYTNPLALSDRRQWNISQLITALVQKERGMMLMLLHLQTWR